VEGSTKTALRAEISRYDRFGEEMDSACSAKTNPQALVVKTGAGHDDLPLTVRDAATYLGVSIQTVYLWAERKQIPHLRVMGRNIRFLKSELEAFRATFRQEVRSAIAQSMP
jgi:excisionase family DNA binding protein